MGAPSKELVLGGQEVSADRPEPWAFVTVEDDLNQAGLD